MEAIIAVILILTVALIFSPLGLGGGVLYVPILHYIAGWEFIEAILASLVMVLMVAVGSSIAHSKSGRSNAKIANIGRLTAVPSAILGSIIAWLIITNISDIINKILAIMILIFVIQRILLTKEKNFEKPDNLRGYKIGTAFGGLASGMLGIGGGAVFVTMNRSFLGMDIRSSAGTSYMISMAVVPVALLTHLIFDGTIGDVLDKTGYLVAVFVPIGGILSSYFGAKFAIQHLPKKVITYIFISAVSLGLLRYIWDIIQLIQ